jgi:hypothetical protein
VQHPLRLSGLVHGLCLLGLLGGAACSSRPPASAEARTDADRDGVIDADDFCPSVAEDRDRCYDEDGCPDLDDGRADAVVKALVARGIEARRLKPAVGRPTQLGRQHWISGIVEFYVRRSMDCSRE